MRMKTYSCDDGSKYYLLVQLERLVLHDLFGVEALIRNEEGRINSCYCFGGCVRSQSDYLCFVGRSSN